MLRRWRIAEAVSFRRSSTSWHNERPAETASGGSSGLAAASPARLALNHWSLSGDWTAEDESAQLSSAGGSITFRFHARDLNLVLAPAASGAPVRFTVRLDGHLPGHDHGIDVDESGEGTLDEPRMYQLVRQRGGAADCTFEITFEEPGVRAYVFTFG